MPRRSWPERVLGARGPWPAARSRGEEHLDAVIGFLVFWVLVLVVVVVWVQLATGSAAGWAVLLAGLALGVGLLIRARYALAGKVARERSGALSSPGRAAGSGSTGSPAAGRRQRRW